MRFKQPKLLYRYFSGMAEYTFQTQLGVADPPLLDYLSDLLARFIRSEEVYRMRSLSGKPLRSVAEMLAEARERVGEARREVHRHIGDYTLFWTGIYPEAVHRLQSRTWDDRQVNYSTEGKRAYWIASTIETDDPRSAPGEVLERLSEQFELVAYGLREVRRQWEGGEDTTPPPTFLIN